MLTHMETIAGFPVLLMPGEDQRVWRHGDGIVHDDWPIAHKEGFAVCANFIL